jgi:5'(3')-deoxyribonucleotidase
MSDIIEDRIALIDLDGTLADYDAAMILQMALLKGPGETEMPHRPGVSDDSVPAYLTARRKIIQRTVGFWRNLKRIPLGFEVVEVMRACGYQLHVLSKGPTSSPNAWTEKLEWCKEHLPDAAVTISGDKSLVYGRVLFDDYPPYFEGWLAKRPRGLVICLGHPWNEDFRRGGSKEHPNVLRYDGSKGAHIELAIRLKRAYERASKEQL